ncbi:hypothetical protein POPTR_006G208200v4 [Populus trichocarpa]|uniref:Uncharacterized protein n=1 Tax=Populus trichocarpa TaxID=3694 RepID=A0ACC0SVR4_POPTR|nr:hypothetical protein BDE02_06G180000 [Populus trichocarpa]KAI9393293.1 hypothetical protein POPTR_006G208200v4 [Populus trichocarpa]
MIMYSVITDSCRVITILIIEIKPALSCWTQPSQVLRSAVDARGGMETLWPALQLVYMTRASTYRDALKSFIQGYQELRCSAGHGNERRI